MQNGSPLTTLVLRALLLILQYLRHADKTGYPMGEGSPFRQDMQDLEFEILNELEHR